MASSGLLALLGGAAKYGVRQQERKDDLKDEERKMQLRMDLEQKLMVARQTYAKANPTFQQFFNTDEGIVGVTDQGTSALTRAATPEAIATRKALLEQAAAKETREDNYKSAMANAATENAAAAKIRAGAAVTSANRPRVGARPRTRMEKTPDELRASAISTLKLSNSEIFKRGEVPKKTDPMSPAFEAAVAAEAMAKRKQQVGK